MALQDSNANGVLDRLEPAVGFQLQSIAALRPGYAVNWSAMPGHAYQVVSADRLGAVWSNLPAGLATAGPVQLYLSVTDMPPAGVTQRFYRVKLVP